MVCTVSFLISCVLHNYNSTVIYYDNKYSIYMHYLLDSESKYSTLNKD